MVPEPDLVTVLPKQVNAAAVGYAAAPTRQPTTSKSMATRRVTRMTGLRAIQHRLSTNQICQVYGFVNLYQRDRLKSRVTVAVTSAKPLPAASANRDRKAIRTARPCQCA